MALEEEKKRVLSLPEGAEKEECLQKLAEEEEAAAETAQKAAEQRQKVAELAEAMPEGPEKQAALQAVAKQEQKAAAREQAALGEPLDAGAVFAALQAGEAQRNKTPYLTMNDWTCSTPAFNSRYGSYTWDCPMSFDSA